MLRPSLKDLREKVGLNFNKECRNSSKKGEKMTLSLQEEQLPSEKNWKVIECMNRLLLDLEQSFRMLEGNAQSR
jgi:hypothetical protein